MNALKEWATVVQALEAGDQLVLLRKGGILDVASGFVFESKKFLLFPTFEHQSFDNIKAPFHKYLNFVNESKSQDGTNRITSYAEVIAETDLTDKNKINKLSEFHIWSDSYISTRMAWMPQKAIKVAFLKTYLIDEFEIPLKPEYHGCKSWIEINANIDSGRPVLSESELRSKLQKFKEIVN
ncbi:MAG: DUF1802 family protein [Candidatus Nitrosotenuis sp.]